MISMRGAIATVAATLVALLLVASDLVFVLACALFALYVWLLSGFLVVPASPTRMPRSKVFCIGLSRTGTTSITVALHELGYIAHHQCHALVEHGVAGAPRVNRYWADALDAHADIAPATVFEELAKAYPDARFVLTRREPRAWARAMVRFCSKFRLILASQPVATMFADIYGQGWSSYTQDEWVRVYENHERRVSAVFASAPHRLLKLDIVNGDGWAPLCDFLGDAPPPSGTPFPHADVFALSSWTQVGWQLKRLRNRFGRVIVAAFVLILALRPAVADHGQCTRACRVANAQTGSPPVYTFTGDWFASSIHGRRQLLAPSTCSCYHTGDALHSAPLEHPTVARLHPAIDTADQWHFNTKRVCAADGHEYASAATAHAAGMDVVNCGQCAKCSSVESVDAMHAHSTSLTKRASLAAIIYLLAGEGMHRLMMRSPLVGFDAPCADCWLAATQCNLASCAQHCLYGWTNPLSASSTINGSTDLNACMKCDEVHCSAYFLQACGANRRTAGVVSDIHRPPQHVCTAAHDDALIRADPAPPVKAYPNSTGPHARVVPPSPPSDHQMGWYMSTKARTASLAASIAAFIAALLVLLRVVLGPRSRPLPVGHYERPRRMLLTGCASGMGRRLTGRLLRNGHSVLATDVNSRALTDACNADGWQRLSQQPGGLMLRSLDVRHADVWASVLADADKAWVSEAAFKVHACRP